MKENKIIESLRDLKNRVERKHGKTGKPSFKESFTKISKDK